MAANVNTISGHNNNLDQLVDNSLVRSIIVGSSEAEGAQGNVGFSANDYCVVLNAYAEQIHSVLSDYYESLTAKGEVGQGMLKMTLYLEQQEVKRSMKRLEDLYCVGLKV
jgi:hypothetical protein